MEVEVEVKIQPLTVYLAIPSTLQEQKLFFNTAFISLQSYNPIME